MSMNPHNPAVDPQTGTPNRLIRAAIWVAIGSLIAAALVCVVWVLLSPDDDIIGRAFLTILLLAGFAGICILEAQLATRREAWFALTSMGVWILTLLIGAVMIWLPETNSYGYMSGPGRLLSFLTIVLVLQLAVLHVRLYTRALLRHSTTFNTIVTYVTVTLVAILTIMLVIPLMISEYVTFAGLYWRIVVAVAILAAVGTALVPLINALFAPKRERRQPQGYAQPHTYAQLPHTASVHQGYGAEAPAAVPNLGAYPPPQWPTYVDGFTPLPVLPDGTPDWNAYYTGVATYPQASEQHRASPPVTPPTPSAYLAYSTPPLPPVPPVAPPN